jgi:serine/threonine-protein kinase HipA
MSDLAVWLADRRAGTLSRKPNGNLQFRYDPAYEGPPLSQSLPLQEGAHGDRAARAMFGGLLPEGDVRRTVAQNLGLSERNDYGLLEELGGDVAGAITLLPEDVRPPDEPRSEPVDDERLAQLLDQLPQRPLAVDPSEGIRLSLAGAQPKLPLIIDDQGRLALPTNSAAPTTHILKPEPARFPGLVDNEGFCMALARACELSVAPVSKAQTMSGTAYLIVERYDRDLTAEPIRRLHQEDFCQALGLPAEQKYQQEGGPSVPQCAALIRRATPIPAQELPRLLRAVVFNWIVGNCDAHGKNYSLLYDQGAPSLAPLYDLISTVVYPELTTRLAMSVNGARTLREVTSDAWLALAIDAGYRPAFVTRTVDDLLERADDEAAALVGTTEHDNATARMIAARIQALRSS